MTPDTEARPDEPRTNLRTTIRAIARKIEALPVERIAADGAVGGYSEDGDYVQVVALGAVLDLLGDGIALGSGEDDDRLASETPKSGLPEARLDVAGDGLQSIGGVGLIEGGQVDRDLDVAPEDRERSSGHTDTVQNAVSHVNRPAALLMTPDTEARPERTGEPVLTAETARALTEFSLYRKAARTLISDRTFPPGTVYQTPEGLRAEDEDTRAALDVQGGIYPIRVSVFEASYVPDDEPATPSQPDPSGLDVAAAAFVRHMDGPEPRRGLWTTLKADREAIRAALAATTAPAINCGRPRSVPGKDWRCPQCGRLVRAGVIHPTAPAAEEKG